MHKAVNRQILKGIYDGIARRYDRQHAFLTAGSDQRGRIMVVDKTVKSGDRILDCGAGTGSTALLAAEKTGPAGRVVTFDMSEGMLAVAQSRAVAAGVCKRIECRTGDMLDLPFEDNSFDAVLSTYSLCPLYDPAQGARELYRVVRPGGLIGAAHSTNPERPSVKWLADKVENVVWRFPSLSLGCRSVSVLPALTEGGGRIIFRKHIGFPLWPFLVFVVEKPAS